MEPIHNVKERLIVVYFTDIKTAELTNNQLLLFKREQDSYVGICQNISQTNLLERAITVLRT